MAKGYEQNQERRQALAFLGKGLARRARSKCELTHASGVPLATYEIPPVPADPEIDRCLLISESAREQLDKPRNFRPDEWRHLNDLVWSDLPAVQVMALRILRFLAGDHAWARQILDDFYPDPEVAAWADQAPLS